jgi:hypothetical protein
MSASGIMTPISQSIAAWPVSIWIGETGWVIPIVQSVHIIAIAGVMSSIAMLNLRLAGLIGRGQSVRTMAQWFLPWVWWGLPILLTTGLVMVVGEPERELESGYFWSKMLMVVIVTIATLGLQRGLEDAPFSDLSARKRLTMRAVALGSLVLWVAIIFCGRWIAYG